jgi:hypothetical protein
LNSQTPRFPRKDSIETIPDQTDSHLETVE